MEDLITGFFEFFFDLLIGLVNILFIPIDSLINNFMPTISSGIDYINQFFAYILQFIPWVMSWFNLPLPFLQLILSYYTFKLTVPLLVHTVKLAISWYEKIKL